MYNKIINGILLFTAGAIVGGTGTYFYLKKFNKIEYEIIKPAIKEQSKTEPEEKGEEHVSAEIVDYDEMTDGNIMDYYNEAANNVDSHHIDYSAINRPKVEDVPEKTPKIYEITQEDFINCDLGFEQDTFILYEGDMTFVDETNGSSSPIHTDDIQSTISEELFEKFRDDSDIDVMYIRNLMYGTDYELCKRNDSYSEIADMYLEE